MVTTIVAFKDLLVSEIFHSLQGETSLSGVRFAFIRLSGCNLRCTYCDSAYAFKGGIKMSIPEILKAIENFNVKHVLLTGGEPLMQRQTPALLDALNLADYSVSIETHGETSIAAVAKNARIVMDIKTPSSGMSRGGYLTNFQYLKKTDEIKFIIASQEDYAWAREIVQKSKIPCDEILFSPAVAALNSPGQFSPISSHWLAEQILRDQLNVRLQVQLHKLLWGADRRGV
jgi:7-carboxy-7-deazaguanine synthase